MEELIVDDIPIFTRVLKKCLSFCSISLDKNTQKVLFGKLACSNFEDFKMCSVAMQTKCKPNKPGSSSCGATIYIYIYMIYVRWL